MVIYLLYFITLLVEYVLNLYKFRGAQQNQIADPASTLAPAEETSSGDFAPIHVSDEEAGPDQQHGLEPSEEEAFPIGSGDDGDHHRGAVQEVPS